MADNVTLPGTGVVIASDDVASVQFQQVKLVDGTLGSTAAIGGDATNGLDVDVTRVIPGTSATHLGKAEDAAHASGDVGVMALAVRADTATALAGTDGDYIPLIVDSAGRLHVNLGKNVSASSAAITAVPGNASSVSILASNASRKGAIIFNDSTAALYIKFGATASTTSFTYKIFPNGTWEMSQNAIYTGAIDGIWDSATGNARVTEL